MTAQNYFNSQNPMISYDYSWFLAKNLSNFVSLSWKLYNRYCHNYDKCPKNREQTFCFKNCAHSQAKLLFSQCNFLHAYFFAGRHSWKLKDIPTFKEFTQTSDLQKNVIKHSIYQCGQSKEYIERRHGDHFEFLFLPKMGLLCSQASSRKKSKYELWATFDGKKILNLF